MNIGAIIKLNRINQNLTQEELADGIISISYLSKIENGKIEPNEEVIKLLCRKLGIQINNQIDDSTKVICNEWFHLLLTSSNIEEIKQKYKEINEVSKTIHDSELQLLIKIHMIRYYLKIGETTKALEQINNLKDVSGTFNNLQKYYWYKFNGNYYSIIEEENDALRNYTLSEDLLPLLELKEDEIADILYSLAVTYSKHRLTSEAQSYANRALEYYRQVYNFSRCAECHLVLGICYRRINNHEKAIKNYHLAKQLAESTQNKKLIRLTHLNMGYLYFVQGNNAQAIKYLDMIVNESDATLHDRLLALTSIIGESYNSNNLEEAKKRIMQGLSWINSDNKNKYISFYYEILSYLYLIDENHEKFENLLVNEFIPYLKEQKDYVKLTEYAEMLGKHFESTHKYKNATTYYKLVNFSYKQITKL
ncbi:helix-turn-helix domain-containing protein [Heyndrickxia sporothermodurans]|uniref:helix-turn-helix domain-containing protein n=1 Tax=Heyndrickxia sporothermodurans TaxID=46224 RepID=UPI002DB6053F|nr:helix-turn-helix domain-containing protein [Heyndrickxia sporothermodurans]MEB6549825.1 helix-turn-helix domain-containing protein [Heyndrickxia sporothermodurans]